MTPERALNDSRQPSVPLLVIALLWSTAALVFVARDMASLAVFAAVCSAAAIAVECVRMCLAEAPTAPETLNRYIEQARSGRKLAIYDRDTGLFAHWYMTLRGQEECARAERYHRGLSMLIVEPRPASATAEWAVKGQIDRWVQTELRATDLAGYLGNSRYLILAPEADAAAGERLVSRLHDEVGQVDIGFSAFPQDGTAFQDLWDRANARLGGREPLAA
jgi:hypothetical protein